jgi:Na+/melibiose symporter-like transporter
MPLAMVSLPIYIQVPSYYTSQLGMSLTATGLTLFIVRLIDTVQDPWLGNRIDRYARMGRLRLMFWVAGSILALGFAALWFPQVSGPILPLWFGFSLVVCYGCHSLLNIAYISWGSLLADVQQKPAAAWREGFGLLGVVTSCGLFGWGMARPAHAMAASLAAFAAVFALMLMGGIWLLLHRAEMQKPIYGVISTWYQPLGNRAFARLLPPYFFNALAGSISATLALFFIADRLQMPAWAGLFLASYFLAGALGLPVWVRLANRLGDLAAWRLSMVVAASIFISVYQIKPGDFVPYLVICLLAGFCLGADLMLPTVLLARRIPMHHSPGSYFGLWSLLGKLALALSGLMLPLLEELGYHPGHAAGQALVWTYAGVPCLLKILAAVLLSFVLSSQKDPFDETLDSHAVRVAPVRMRRP